MTSCAGFRPFYDLSSVGTRKDIRLLVQFPLNFVQFCAQNWKTCPKRRKVFFCSLPCMNWTFSYIELICSMHGHSVAKCVIGFAHQNVRFGTYSYKMVCFSVLWRNFTDSNLFYFSQNSNRCRDKTIGTIWLFLCFSDCSVDWVQICSEFIA